MKHRILTTVTSAVLLGIVSMHANADSKNHSFSSFKPINESANSAAWDPAAP